MSVTVGGPPPEAEHHRERIILVGATPTSGVGLMKALDRRLDQARVLHGYRHQGRWWVEVYDGWGVPLVTLTPDGLDGLADAKRVMTAAELWLRELGAQHPDVWEVAGCSAA